MNQILINTLLLLLFSVKVIAQNNYIAVVADTSDIEISGRKLGSTVFKETGFRVKCKYEQGINYLKNKAREIDANLIKITMHKSPDAWSSCHRFKADLYSVEDPYLYELEFEWSNNRKLNWSDFKAEIPLSANDGLAAETYCGIEFSGRAANMFSKSKFVVKATFFKNRSWATNDKQNRNDYVLNHEQKHFDLCEIYARILYKELIESNLNAFNISGANDIFNRVQLEYHKRQYKYDEETAHGINTDAQRKWNKTIAEELLSLEKYADHN